MAVSITPIHACVPGRARLKVGGLQGSSVVKDVLERGGRAAPGVVNITVSDITGTVLVEFEETSELNPIIDYLAGLLRGEITVSEPSPHPQWHTLSPARLSSVLDVSFEAGLSREIAWQRLKNIGPNEVRAIQPRSGASILAGQFQSLPVAMLLGAAAIFILTGGMLEAAAILAMVGVNAVIGYETESRAERTIQALAADGPRTAQVLREGAVAAIQVHQLVPGDVISVQRGDVVPADCRLVDAQIWS